MASCKQDEKFMRRCLELAELGEGKVSPNPMVGAVLVRNGKIISEGFHEKFGGHHAEVNCLRGADARGCTLYVSLEPCSHSGTGKKTPPCVPLIISSGVSRVVIAAVDENPLVEGRGVFQLQKAGIEVEVGVLEAEAKRQNAPFFKSIRFGKPFVALKMAQTREGIIGVQGKRNVRISGKRFDAYSQRLRNRYDAILVGINTILSDDPLLTCRVEGGRNPARIILDSSLRIPFAAKALRNAKAEKVIIATGERFDSGKRRQLERMGAKVITSGREMPSLEILLRTLPSLGVHSLLIEGGATVAADAISRKLADKAIICVSPKKIARAGAVLSPFTKELLAGLFGKTVTKMGEDTVIEGYF